MLVKYLGQKKSSCVETCFYKCRGSLGKFCWDGVIGLHFLGNEGFGGGACRIELSTCYN